MSDPGVSTQNFLRLLLGGMQKGTDVFQNRQTMQQQQAPDLMLTLQQMMQRKQMADQELSRRDMEFKQGQANWEKSFEAQQGAASAARARQGNADIYNMMQGWRDDTNKRAEFELNKQKTMAMIEHYKGLAAKARADAGSAQDIGEKRLKADILKSLLAGIEKQGQTIETGTYDALPKSAQKLWEPILASDGSTKGYRSLPPELRRRHGELTKQLQELGDIGDPGAQFMTDFSGGPFMDTTNEEDLLQYLPE